MDFVYSPEEEAFRAEVRAFIRDPLPKRSSEDLMDVESGMSDLPALFKWNQDLYEKRWVGFNWPREVGGGGGSISAQMILKEEMARVKAPMLGSATWASPGSDPRSSSTAPRPNRSSTSAPSCAASSSGAPVTPSPVPAAISRRSSAKPSVTATTTSSTDRRSGPASRCGRSG